MSISKCNISVPATWYSSYVYKAWFAYLVMWIIRLFLEPLLTEIENKIIMTTITVSKFRNCVLKGMSLVFHFWMTCLSGDVIKIHLGICASCLLYSYHKLMSSVFIPGLFIISYSKLDIHKWKSRSILNAFYLNLFGWILKKKYKL